MNLFNNRKFLLGALLLLLLGLFYSPNDILIQEREVVPTTVIKDKRVAKAILR